MEAAGDNTFYATRGRHIRMGIIKDIIVALFILLVSGLTVMTVVAQGDLQVKGTLVNVNDEYTLSLITLYEVAPNTGEWLTLGQFMVQGNDWFKTRLYYDKTYVVEIASNDGLTKRLQFKTDIPKYATETFQRLTLSIDMTSVGNWTLADGGTVMYDRQEDEFYYDPLGIHSFIIYNTVLP